MSKPLIIKCNMMFPDYIIEAYRQDIMKQMEDGVVILPPGFELAEVNVELLEQIKAEIMATGNWKSKYEISNSGVIKAVDIIDNHISELKGENK